MMLRIYPDHGELDEDDAYDDLALGERAPVKRPYVIVNMVSTVDGQARVGADTELLGGRTDQRLLIKLREQVDCVLAGPHTVRIERYKGPASRPETQVRREARGLRPRPLFATLSRGGDLPWDAPLFQDPDVDVVVFSSAEIPTDRARATVTQVRTDNPAVMLTELRERMHVRSVLIEGGPHVNREFLAVGAVDELFLTVAPMLTGSVEPFPIVAGDLPRAQELSLISVLLDDGEVFLRYRVASPGGSGR